MIEEISICNSFIQRLDPRFKIVEVLFFSVIVAVSNRFTVLVSALIIGSIIVFAARVPINELKKRLIPVNIFILFLWFFLPFTFSGEVLFSLGPLSITREGVLYAARISIKSNAIMLFLIAMIASTPISSLGHALYELGAPKKMVHLFFFTYRYIHVIYKEYSRIITAAKIRCFSPKTNLHTYKTYAYMVGMLLVKSHDRAQRVHNAMLCRSFDGHLYSLSRFSFKLRDFLFFTFFAAVILALGILEWTKII